MAEDDDARLLNAISPFRYDNNGHKFSSTFTFMYDNDAHELLKTSCVCHYLHGFLLPSLLACLLVYCSSSFTSAFQEAF